MSTPFVEEDQLMKKTEHMALSEYGIAKVHANGNTLYFQKD